jgi:hypothetical protein
MDHEVFFWMCLFTNLSSHRSQRMPSIAKCFVRFIILSGSKIFTDSFISNSLPMQNGRLAQRDEVEYHLNSGHRNISLAYGHQQ